MQCNKVHIIIIISTVLKCNFKVLLFSATYISTPLHLGCYSVSVYLFYRKNIWDVSSFTFVKNITADNRNKNRNKKSDDATE